jgi:hypothetical protein
MAEGLTKYKVVSFRISDADYEKIEAAGRRYGFTSAALFARAAALREDSPEPVRTPLDLELNRLWRRLEALSSALEQLSARMSVIIDRVRSREDPVSCSLT